MIFASGTSSDVITVDLHASGTDVRALGERNDPDRGLVVAHAPIGPVSTTGDHMWLAILTAIGCDAGGTGAKVTQGDQWTIYTLAWLEALGINDLVLLGADDLNTDTLRMLTRRLSRLPIRIWLVSHARHHQIAQFSDRTATPAELQALLTAPPIETQTTDDLAGIVLPSGSCLTFRAECRALLDPAAFATVDRYYLHAFAQTRHALTTDDPQGLAERTVRLIEELTAPHLSDTAQRIIIHAIQCAALAQVRVSP